MISPPRAKFSANCCPPARAKCPASISPPRTARRANSAAISTIFFRTAKAAWPLPLATSPAKAPPRRSSARSPIGIIREHIVDHPCPPAEMLAMLNNRLHGARLDSRFIATVFSVYDAGTRRLTLANAGAPVSHSGSRRRCADRFASPAFLSGLYPDTEYEEITLDLQPGDAVLFASDGILESENAELEEFGMTASPPCLAQCLAATFRQRHRRQIIAATDQHTGEGLHARDDRTLARPSRNRSHQSDFSKLPIIY